MVPTIPAIMNAIYHAIGVRIQHLPATPKVLMALREKERREAELTPRRGGGVGPMSAGAAATGSAGVNGVETPP